MTRKDYEMIAAAIRRQMTELDPGTNSDAVALVALDNLAADLAGELTATNPRFDQARFLRACRVL